MEAGGWGEMSLGESFFGRGRDEELFGLIDRDREGEVDSNWFNLLFSPFTVLFYPLYSVQKLKSN